jgi:hypothetical protein
MSAESIQQTVISGVPANNDLARPLQVANADTIDIAAIGRYTLGVSVYSTFSWLFDYPLFGSVIWYFGPLKGGIIMLVLSLVVDLCSIRLYDWSKKDWLALEFIRSHRLYSGGNVARRLVHWILTKTPVPIQVIFLSLKFNAFIVTALLREQQSSFNGLTRKDREIFALSFISAQLYWSLCISAGVQGVSWLVSVP